MGRKTIGRRLPAALVCAGLLALVPGMPAAHHSFAMYDQSIRYVFTGVVERINPDGSHLQIVFVPLNDRRNALVRDSSGKPASWLVEMGGSAAVAREGITVDGMPRGTVFSVGLVPLRNGQRGGARVEGLFTCPKSKPPEPGRHCDSVEGAMSHGGGALARPTDIWRP